MNVEAKDLAGSLLSAESTFGSGAYVPRPLALVRGEGVHVWDADGNKYLDFSTGIGVAVLGHAHPRLVGAISDQASQLMTAVNGYFHNDVRAELLAKLVEISPEGLDRIFLSNSGTEAVECALKLARASTGRIEVIAANKGFHGRTLGSLSATAKAAYQDPFVPLVPGFGHVPFGDLDALANAVTEETAAVLLEPIQGEAGIFPAPEGYLAGAQAICKEQGALLILDEIQSGMGRTGQWLASQHDDVVPDIACLAKALGGGVPVGATLFNENLKFEKGQHGSTFGGNPLAARAALAVIESIEQENLLENVSDVGAYFRSGLESLADAKSDLIKEVRGRGLMLGVQMRGRIGKTMQNLYDRGFLAVASGSTIIRMLPPYIVSSTDIDAALNIIEDSLA